MSFPPNIKEGTPQKHEDKKKRHGESYQYPQLHFLVIFLAYLLYLRIVLTDNTTDYTKPVIRPSLMSIWPLFLSIHLLIWMCGLVSSLCMCVEMYFTRLHKNNTGIYLINLLVINFIILCVELPLNFILMVYENWVYGMMMCYFSSVLPYILVHSSMFNFILMAVDRYRSIAHPNKRQLNIVASVLTIWLFSICAAMPVIPYVHFEDISHFDIRLDNNGLCWSTADNYCKIVFVTIFTMPTVLIVFILMKISAELKLKEELCKTGSRNPQGSISTEKTNSFVDVDDLDSLDGMEIDQKNQRNKAMVEKEKVTQKYLTMMTALWILCWVPMKVFSAVNSHTNETEENTATIDIAHMIFLPISAISTITTPVCFMIMRRSVKRDSLLYRHKKSEINNYDFTTTEPGSSQSSTMGHQRTNKNSLAQEPFLFSKLR